MNSPFANERTDFRPLMTEDKRVDEWAKSTVQHFGMHPDTSNNSNLQANNFILKSTDMELPKTCENDQLESKSHARSSTGLKTVSKERSTNKRHSSRRRHSMAFTPCLKPCIEESETAALFMAEPNESSSTRRKSHARFSHGLFDAEPFKHSSTKLDGNSLVDSQLTSGYESRRSSFTSSSGYEKQSTTNMLPVVFEKGEANTAIGEYDKFIGYQRARTGRRFSGHLIAPCSNEFQTVLQQLNSNM